MELEETRASSSKHLFQVKYLLLFLRYLHACSYCGADRRGSMWLLEFGVAYALSAFSSTFGRSPQRVPLSTLPSVAKGDECMWILTTEDGHCVVCVSESASAIPESR